MAGLTLNSLRKELDALREEAARRTTSGLDKEAIAGMHHLAVAEAVVEGAISLSMVSPEQLRLLTALAECAEEEDPYQAAEAYTASQASWAGTAQPPVITRPAIEPPEPKLENVKDKGMAEPEEVLESYLHAYGPNGAPIYGTRRVPR